MMRTGLFSLIMLGGWVMMAHAEEQAANKVVFKDDFKSGLENWVAEKWEEDAVKVSHENEKMKVSTTSRQHGTMLWCKQELPKNYRIEFDFTPLSKSGFFLIFFSAKGIDGKSVLDESHFKDRTAPTLFKKYTKGKINCYHISYRRGEAANCNLRKNSGQKLLKQQKLSHLLPKDKTVHVALTKKGGHLTLEVDGKIFMDHTDKADSYGGGHFALRQVYESVGTYDNVTVTEID